MALLPCLAALFACGQASEPPSAPVSPATEATPETPPPGNPVATLVGEYRVAGVDGAPLVAEFGVALSVTETRIVVDGSCGGYAWDYQLAATQLTVTRVVTPDPDCLATTSVRRSVHDLVAALDAVTRASRTPSNGIELAGGARSVTLYSQ